MYQTVTIGYRRVYTMKPKVILLFVGSCLLSPLALAEDLAIGSELAAGYYANHAGSNTLRAAQIGTHNDAELVQLGQRNTASVYQQGSGNDAAILQVGGYHSADIAQAGLGHDAQIVQRGHGKQASIDQRGSYASADIQQLGSSTTPVHVTQLSRGGTKVQVIQR